jgi:neutral amino acid transport system permease protein
VIEQLGNGLLLGAIIAMTSVGLALIFSVTGSFSFAHGDVVTLGAMTAVALATAVGSVWLGLLGALVLMGLLGGVLDVALLRPLRRAGVGGISLLVTTLGLALIIRYGMLAVAGPGPRAMPMGGQRVVSVLGTSLTPLAIGCIVVAVVLLVAIAVCLTRTELGTSMRAVASNKPLAAASGIDVARVTTATWVFGTVTAGIGGVMLALTQLVSWDMGFQMTLLMFAGAIIGGLTSPYGAMVGGFAIGLVTQLSLAVPIVADHADMKIAVAMLVMVAMLLVRPQGILGRKVRLS